MTDPFFGAAGTLTAIWLLVHLFIGGREIVRPFIRDSALTPTARDTLYQCWHFTTAAIACMAAFFLLASVSDERVFATCATLLAGSYFLSGVGLVTSLGESHARLPQGWLFLPVTALGIAGHLL